MASAIVGGRAVLTNANHLPERIDMPHEHEPDRNLPDVEIIDHQARLSRLVVHVSQLVGRGGRVEEQHGYRAVVSMPRRDSMVPNMVMSAAGVGLFLWVGDLLFLVAAGVALLGWHRKLVAGAERMLLLVRVDDAGQVSEQRVEAT